MFLLHTDQLIKPKKHQYVKTSSSSSSGFLPTLKNTPVVWMSVFMRYILGFIPRHSQHSLYKLRLHNDSDPDKVLDHDVDLIFYFPPSIFFSSESWLVYFYQCLKLIKKRCDISQYCKRLKSLSFNIELAYCIRMKQGMFRHVYMSSSAHDKTLLSNKTNCESTRWLHFRFPG